MAPLLSTGTSPADVWQRRRFPTSCQTPGVKLSDNFAEGLRFLSDRPSGKVFCLHTSPENKCEGLSACSSRTWHAHPVPGGRDNPLCPRLSPALVRVRATPGYSSRGDSADHRRASPARLPRGPCE